MRLLTLGRLQLENGRFSRPKPLLLVAFLALEGARDRRYLSELFWPTAARPMASLRVAVSQLRQAEPNALIASYNHLSAGLPCDVVDLLNALEREEFAQASEAYHGAFLGGVDLPGVGLELEEWVYKTREFVAERVREASLTVAERDAHLGDLARAGKRAADAYAVPGAPPPEPDQLARIHTLLTAADHPLHREVQREGLEYDLDLPNDREAARAALLSGSRATQGSSHNLPAPIGEFVGRDPERIEILGLLDDESVRLTTIVGPGGIGKSRLAVEVARELVRGGQFEGSVWFVPLESLTRTDEVISEIALAAGVSLQNTTDPTEGLAKSLGEKRVLLVLDNCEHLSGLATPVVTLLERCPQLKVLATSRNHLHVPGEQIFPLEGLAVGAEDETGPVHAHRFDAVELFSRRARRVRPGFELDETQLPAVRRICRRLQGYPLGIELAASLMRLLSPAEIAEQLENDAELLVQPIPGVEGRHATLAAVFEHSWELLATEEREALMRLAAFHGGFTRAAAAEVARAGIHQLAALLDKSLLRFDRTSRFDRHPLVHEFTQQKLSERPALMHEAGDAHSRWALAYSQTGTDDVSAWLERIEAERENLLAALRWSLQEFPDRSDEDAAAMKTVGLQLTAGLYRYWYYRSRFREGREWLERALEFAADLAGNAADHLRSSALHGAGVLANELGDTPAATAHLERRVELARRLGDNIAEAASLNSLGVIAWEEGDLDRAHEMIQRSLLMRREAGRDDLVPGPLLNLGLVALARNDLEGAQSCFEQSLAAARAGDDDMSRAVSLANLGIVHLDRRDPRAAVPLFSEAVEAYRTLGNKDGIGRCVVGFASAAALEGRYRQAARLSGTAARMREALGITDEPDDLARSERHLRPAREALGDEAYLDEWERGRQLEHEEALEQILSS